MLISLDDGVEDGHGGQNVGSDGLSGIYLLLSGFCSGFLLTGSIAVMHCQPSKANNQTDHNGADNGG
ncbi:hypothetical protein ACYA0F_13140 [Klebsiella pneumoniae]